MQHEYTVRDRTVRVSVDAVATRPPGRTRTWTVEAGHWRAEGATEKAAADALTAGLTAFLAHYRPPKTLTFRGHAAVVSLDIGDSREPLNWHQEVIWPDGRVSSSTSRAEDWDEAESRARHTLAQASTDWHDDDNVREAAAYLDGGQRAERGRYGPDEFLRYAAWQRAAKAAMDAGRTDWHEWAGQHAAEFAITAPAELSREGEATCPL